MKITNVHGLPQSIVNAVTNDTYTGPKNNSLKLSVSSIKDSPRIFFLKQRHWDEMEEDVSERLWALLGSSVHAILERAEDANSIKEERIEIEVDGLIVSGQMDILKEHRIEDYKVTSVRSIIYNPDGKKEWEIQQNIYRWLAHSKGFDIKELVINVILRDFQSSKAKIGPPYPRIPFMSIKLPVWDIDVTKKYIEDRVALFKSCANLPDNELPQCTNEDMWAKEGTWAIMKEGRKSAIKVCKTPKEADNNVKKGEYIEVRPGSRNRCHAYCSANKFCNQYAEYMSSIGAE